MSTKSASRATPMLLVLLAFLATTVDSFGQDRPQWRTSREIQSGRNGYIVGTVEAMDEYRLTLTLRFDDTSSATARVTTDAGSTSYRGFGDGSSSDVLRGERGFGRIRRGDRVQVTGVGGSSATLAASEVRFLGRSTTGRAPGTTTTVVVPKTELEGTVRGVNATEGTIVVESSDRKLTTVRGDDATPVSYKGTMYRIRNIEVGDVVRVRIARTVNNEIKPSSIEVQQSVSDSTANRTDRTVGALKGRVVRVDTRAETFRVQPESGREIRVDVADARDDRGRILRLADITAGDYVEVTGKYDTLGNLRADMVRETTAPLVFNDGRDRAEDDDVVSRRRDVDDEEMEDFLDNFDSVVVEGRIIESLATSDYLIVRDEDDDRDIRVLADDELVVRGKAGGYVTARQLRIGERITLRAYRHESGVFVAQTVRVR